MLQMRRHFETDSWWVSSAIVGAALLVLATGLCLFDGHGGHHDDETAQDLCFGMIVASLGVSLLAGPLINGWVRSDSPQLVYAVSPHLPDPPPKLSSRS